MADNKLNLPRITNAESTQRAFDSLKNHINNQETVLYRGKGDPNGELAAPLGSLYINENGGSNTSFYIKEREGSSNTGWTPAYTVLPTTLPAGLIFAYAGSSIPTGWLDCDGSAVSRTTYADLFTAIGTTWGAGDGSTTFNIPDLRSATLRGVGTPTLYTSNTVIALAQTIDDQAQGHKHSDPTRGFITASSQISNSGTDPVEVNASTYTAKSYYATTMRDDGTNGTPRIGLETTGKARGVFYIIKY